MKIVRTQRLQQDLKQQLCKATRGAIEQLLFMDISIVRQILIGIVIVRYILVDYLIRVEPNYISLCLIRVELNYLSNDDVYFVWNLTSIISPHFGIFKLFQFFESWSLHVSQIIYVINSCRTLFEIDNCVSTDNKCSISNIFKTHSIRVKSQPIISLAIT